MSVPDVSYSLVIPCYNESGNLPQLVNRCRLLLIERQDVEVILVDNGSSDDTQLVLHDLINDAKNERLRSTRVEVNQGYGFGILSGLNECKGSVLGWTHADLQTDPMDFLGAIALFDNNSEANSIFVKGERQGRPFRDIVFTWGMSLFEWLILGSRMWDINGQPTVFSRKFYSTWKSPPNDFSLDLFAFHKAVWEGITIQRFPVSFGKRLSGEGHNETLLSKLRYSWKTILFSMSLRRHIQATKGIPK